MIERTDIQWLLSFAAVYEKLSFKQAAQHRQLPTSNISRHVAQLEQHLNTRLLERTTRKMRPTAAGKQLYLTLKPLIHTMDDALTEVSQHHDALSGHLNLVMPDLPVLATLIANFCHQHPDIQLSCDTQLNPTEGMLEGLDLVVRFGRGTLEDSGWVAQALLHLPSCVVGAPELLHRHAHVHSLDTLSKVPCITSLTALQGTPWRFKHNRTLHVQSSYKVNSGHMAKAAAVQGLGFAILPRHMCQAELEAGTLVELTLDHEPEDLVLYAFYSGRKYPQKKVTALLSHLKTGLSELMDTPAK
ncbi:LysR family transcriptional regulator [Pseudoalteromonas sp. McH1-42]|uniref:LysR family transcriptional regulator n=1 Tax=Pseudoalteromonas sp. McH1-42 TaxID=2917752 RepID=UPI001EF70A4C|nr:LysR family transcriptional regulator [Pseudoalteromonas sp. McH1-42]MCG7561786.1 LysR family transcriptional regulator [Pseudoalteromonas sp. McH1-42]